MEQSAFLTRVTVAHNESSLSSQKGLRVGFACPVVLALYGWAVEHKSGLHIGSSNDHGENHRLADSLIDSI